MNWSWTSCQIHIIQAELGYSVGANPNNERHVIVQLYSRQQIIPPPLVGGGAMAEWDLYYVQKASHYRGRYDVVHNSLDHTHPYNLGGSSDPKSRVWRWTRKASYISGRSIRPLVRAGAGRRLRSKTLWSFAMPQASRVGCSLAREGTRPARAL
jgi:hypothetical protein